MLLIKLTPQGEPIKLMNAGRIISSVPHPSGTYIMYRGFSIDRPDQFSVTELFTYFKSKINEKSISKEVVTLYVRSIDDVPVNEERPINIESIVYGVTYAGGTLLYCEGDVTGSSRLQVTLAVSSTIDEIIANVAISYEGLGSPVQVEIFGNAGYIQPNQHNLGSIIQVDFFLLDQVTGTLEPYEIYYKIHSDGLIEWQSLTTIVRGVAVIQ